MKTFDARSIEGWRAWLDKHHASASEIWLVFHKKHTGAASVTYLDALDEALCYGWIDSLVRRLDDDRYARKFTPRKSVSKWSAINRRRFARLVREGRVTNAGLAKSPPPEPTTADDSPARSEPAVPPEFRRALRSAPTAWRTFESLAPSYRHLYLRWIAEAKREETRTRRIETAIGLLAAGKKPGLK